MVSLLWFYAFSYEKCDDWIFAQYEFVFYFPHYHNNGWPNKLWNSAKLTVFNILHDQAAVSTDAALRSY